MYSRILVAMDGSAHSERALRYALGLAKEQSATLRILHVVDMGLLPLGPELAIDTEAITNARRAAGDRLLASARERGQAAGIDTEIRLVETATPTQRLATAIVNEAANWPADVVVVGTHGRSGMERLFLGSVAEGVARLSKVPVLLVPQLETGQ
jgi:nucleotide-binding universal stress UspA family protein